MEEKRSKCKNSLTFSSKVETAIRIRKEDEGTSLPGLKGQGSEVIAATLVVKDEGN